MQVDRQSLDRVVKVDVDYKPIDPEQLAWRMRMIEEILGRSFTDLKIYETNKGYHIYAKVSMLEGDLDDKDLVIIQLAMGSDYMRELYNLRRIWKGDITRWNVLFRAKYKEIDGKMIKVSEEKYAKELTRQVIDAYKEIKKNREAEKHLEECAKVSGEEN